MSFLQAYALMITELPKFLKSQNFNLDNIVWFAGLHENTDNRHIHFCFYEKEPLRYNKKRKQNEVLSWQVKQKQNEFV